MDLHSKSRLLSDYERLEGNAFWEAYKKALQEAKDKAERAPAQHGVKGVDDLWALAKKQGVYEAYRSVLGLPGVILEASQLEKP